MLVREARWQEPGVAEALLALESDAFHPPMRYDAEEYARRAAEAGGTLLLAEEGDAVVAFLLAAPDRTRPDALFVDRLVVREGARGRGLGRRLVDEARRRARDLGKRALTTTVDPRNDRTPDPSGFYARLGFRTVRAEPWCVWFEAPA